MPISRRKFLKASAIAGASTYLYFGAEGALLARPRMNMDALGRAAADFGPIADVGAIFGNTDFNGDNYTRAHEALWDLEGYIKSKGGRPSTIWKETRLAVVGGGIAGLTAAYFLRDLSPYVLEQAPRFGGNAKGEKFGGATFGLGAAYVGIPKTGDEIDDFFHELGIADRLRVENPADARVEFKSAGFKKFWDGETDPVARESFVAVHNELVRINKEEYPDIPWSPASAVSQDRFREWDQQTAQDWLKKTFSNLHPHVEEYFQLYCWSSMGGSLSEVSAAQFLGFVASETGGLGAFPGGNSFICDAIYRKLQASQARLMANTFVLEIKNADGGVEILLEDETGALRRLRADRTIVAAPKYVARLIVKDVPEKQSAIWDSLNYRAYVVANVLLKTGPRELPYDSYCLDGSAPATPTFSSPPDRAWTDVVSADWANRDANSPGVLTIFRPYPFDGARNTLFTETAFENIKREVLRDLPDFMKDIGLPADSIADVRLTRWGHAIPLARPGLASDGSLDLIRAPFGRIAFANQDCYVNPAFESCFGSAREAVNWARN